MQMFVNSIAWSAWVKFPQPTCMLLISLLLNLNDTLHNLVIIYTFLFPLNYYLDKVSHWRNILYTNVFALSFRYFVYLLSIYILLNIGLITHFRYMQVPYATPVFSIFTILVQPSVCS